MKKNKKIISNYKEDDEITLVANGIRVTAILLDYDIDYIRLRSTYDNQLITLDYSDIDSVDGEV